MEVEPTVYLPEFTDLDFINEVANFPCLYHHLDSDYKISDGKQECWKQIGETLKCPGNNVMIKSKMLKNVFIFMFNVYLYFMLHRYCSPNKEMEPTKEKIYEN